jgi:hypothetical protein
VAEYPPFRVWMQTTRDITDEASTYVSTEEFEGADGEGIVLPLDPSQISEEWVEVIAKSVCESEGLYDLELSQSSYQNLARAYLTALLGHLADDLAHLTRYFVVDRLDRPAQQCPCRNLANAQRLADHHNTTDARGFAEGRPYRVVTLVPQEAPNA